MFELVVVWSDGSKNTYEYQEKDEAYKAGERMKFALGDQVAWYGVTINTGEGRKEETASKTGTAPRKGSNSHKFR